MSSTTIPSAAGQSSQIPDHNEIQLTREMLINVLHDLSAQVLQLFGRRIRLVVHGGAVMVLHHASRHSTRDVDIISRSFVAEQRAYGVYDAQARLQACISATASRYRLGMDWMNAHADVALPMATDVHGRLYDPIYTTATAPNNITYNTIYSSRGLALIAVTPFWAVALKMVRYAKDDPADIRALLLYGLKVRGGGQWTEELLEGWLLHNCYGMGYETYTNEMKEKMKQRFRHAVAMVGYACQGAIADQPYYANEKR